MIMAGLHTHIINHYLCVGILNYSPTSHIQSTYIFKEKSFEDIEKKIKLPWSLNQIFKKVVIVIWTVPFDCCNGSSWCFCLNDRTESCGNSQDDQHIFKTKEGEEEWSNSNEYAEFESFVQVVLWWELWALSWQLRLWYAYWYVHSHTKKILSWCLHL